MALAVALFASWCVLAFLVAPWLIRSAYAGESLPIFNRLISGQGRNSVDVYLDLWGAKAVQGTLALGVFLVLVLLFLRFREPIDRLRTHLFQSGPRVGPVAVLMLSAWFGLLFGLLETGGRAFKVGMEGVFEYWSNPDYLWMTPVASAVLFVVLGLVLLLLAPGRRPKVSLRVITIVFVAIGAWSTVRVLQLGIDARILWLLAGGLGVHIGRAAYEEPARFLSVARRTLAPLALIVLAALVWLQPVQRLRSARALEALPAVATSGQPNVLLLVLDTVRPQNLSLYGYSRATTPGLEALARRGLVFDRAFTTAPWTLPSHAAMLTGHYASQQSGGWAAPLDSAHPTLAETLGERGYATGGFVGNLLYASAASGLARGFATYADHPANVETWLYSQWALRWVTNRFRTIVPGGAVGFDRKFANTVNEEFLRWLDGVGERPFFAFLNYFDAHMPYEDRFLQEARTFPVGPPRTSVMTAPGERRPLTESEQRDVDMYDGAILFQDGAFSALLSELEARGQLGNTIVLVTADHGEHFHERDLIDHANSLYTPLVHAPLLLVYPPRVPAGRRIEATVSLRDLPATIMDLVGMPDSEPFPGRSLLSVAEGAEGSPVLSEARPSFLTQQVGPISRGPMKSLAVGNLHYVVNGDGVEELFDFAADPFEEVDLIHEDSLAWLLPDLRARLRAALQPAAPGEPGGRE